MLCEMNYSSLHMVMKRSISTPVTLNLWLLLLAAISFEFCYGSINPGYSPIEKKVLLTFNHDLSDPSTWLASWADDDGNYCRWYGVICDNLTGHVELHLRNLSFE